MKYLTKIHLKRYTKMSINKFDVIYYINCEHRTDRRLHIETLLSQLNADSEKVNRINAIYLPDVGALGCAKSHILALKDAKLNGYNNCLILEDDFTAYDVDILNRNIERFFNDVKEWDLVMLSANLFQSEITEHGYLNKVIDAQTTSGYAVNSHFIDSVIEVFEESESNIELGNITGAYSIDQNWKKLQPISNWLAFSPLLGKQLDDWSDIEKRNVSYKC
jgi:GR25 family glycosyltransferase involved in LPS biosynthesis